MKTRSVKLYLEKQILKQSLIGFLLMLIISVVITFFLARFKMATDLQDIAASTAKSFRSRILEGDIKASENQISELLQLKPKEEFSILDPNFKRIYRSRTADLDLKSSATNQNDKNKTNQVCPSMGLTCFNGYFGPASILFPIYFDSEKQNLFGYLFIVRQLQFDWVFVLIVFLIFGSGYMVQLFSLGKITKKSLNQLGQEIELWSLRLSGNPKDRTPLSKAPFSELIPLKEAIEGLNTQIEKFENDASQKAKLMVLRGIAHDILEPVSQMQMGLATLEHYLPDQAVTFEIVKDIEKSVSRVAAIANQVKSLNKVSIDNQVTDLGSEVSEVVRSQSQSKEIINKNCEIQFTNDLSDSVNTQLASVEIQRILQNLIQNAVQASAFDSKICVSLRQEGECSVLTVKDNGCGIPFHLQDKVFEPDFTTKENIGTGLGLSIVKHICEQRGCNIQLESEPHCGTQISIVIPVVKNHNSGGHHVISNTHGG